MPKEPSALAMTLPLAVISPEVVRVATVVSPVNVGEALGAKRVVMSVLLILIEGAVT